MGDIQVYGQRILISLPCQSGIRLEPGDCLCVCVCVSVCVHDCVSVWVCQSEIK